MTAQQPKQAPPKDLTRLSARVTAEIDRALAPELAPGLYLVATPIGNLADITLRALSVLARADVIYCEDTRHSRTLMMHYAIEASLKPYHEHNAATQRAYVLDELSAGRRVALISDAGTPLISDPGFKLVRDAAAAGHAVIALPGPSAAITALTASALPTDAFFFAGFLPTREGARRSRIKELSAIASTLVFFESPTRVAASLADLATVLGDRPAAVARELTKLHEEIKRGTLSDLSRTFAESDVKGEIVIVVGHAPAATATDEDIERALRASLASMSLRDAARVVSDALGIPKARVYDIGLSLKERDA